MPRRRRWPYLVAALAIFLLLPVSWARAARHGLLGLLRPAAALLWGAGEGTLGAGGAAPGGPAREREIQEQKARLAAQENRIRDLEASLAMVSAYRSRGEAASSDVLPVAVRRFAAPGMPGRSTAVVDAGSGEGIARFQAVVSGGGFLGRVDEVGPHSAGLVFLDDPACRVGALLSSSRGQGVVEGIARAKGAGAPELRMKYVLREVPVEVGEEVVTRGEDEVPRGLLIGRVASVEPAPGGVHHDIRITPHADPAAADLLLVILQTEKAKGKK